jgi:tellurite resistance protein TerA
MLLNFENIFLEKSGDTKRINLTKDSASNTLSKEMTINLNWTPKKQDVKSTGLFGPLKKIFSGTDGIKLDLGCFYELRNGAKMVIDGIQFAQGQGGNRKQSSKQGRYTGKPWVWHSGDDRSGGGDGENTLLKTAGLSGLKRVTIYYFIYKGVANWSQTNAFASIKVPDNLDIVVEMGRKTITKMMCALAEINFEGNEGITVKKLISFHNGHADCDKTYASGLQWTAVSK